MTRTLYAVVDKDGEFVRATKKRYGKTENGHYRIYKTQRMAEQYASWEGDAVVALEFNTDHQPLFIRTKTLKPG